MTSREQLLWKLAVQISTRSDARLATNKTSYGNLSFRDAGYRAHRVLYLHFLKVLLNLILFFFSFEKLMERVAEFSVQQEQEHENDQETDTIKSNNNPDETYSSKKVATPEYVTTDFYYHPCDVSPDDDSQISTDESRDSTADSTDRFYDGLFGLKSQSLDKIQLETKQGGDEDDSLSSTLSGISLCSVDSDLSLSAEVEANRENCERQTDTEGKCDSKGMIESLIGYFDDMNRIGKGGTTDEAHNLKDGTSNSPFLGSPMNPVYLISPIFSPLRTMVSSFQRSSRCPDNSESSEKPTSDDEGNVSLNDNDSNKCEDSLPDADNVKEHLSYSSDSSLSTNETQRDLCEDIQKHNSSASDTETDSYMEQEEETDEMPNEVSIAVANDEKSDQMESTAPSSELDDGHLPRVVTSVTGLTGKSDERKETNSNKFKNAVSEGTGERQKERKCRMNHDSGYLRRGYASSTVTYKEKYLKGGRVLSRKLSSERGLKKECSHNYSKQSKQWENIRKDNSEEHTLRRSKSTPKVEKFYFDENNMLVKES